MGMFQELTGDTAIIVSGGVFKQVELYTRDDNLYAKAGGGFVRLHSDGSTSKAGVRIDTLSINHALYRDKLGRLTINPSGTLQLEEDNSRKLLGLSND